MSGNTLLDCSPLEAESRTSLQRLEIGIMSVLGLKFYVCWVANWVVVSTPLRSTIVQDEPTQGAQTPSTMLMLRKSVGNWQQRRTVGLSELW